MDRQPSRQDGIRKVGEKPSGKNICLITNFHTVCVCEVIIFSRLGINQSCLWSAEQGKRFFPCPCLRLRIWSREIGLAVPSRVSLLILHTQGKSGAYLRGSTPLSHSAMVCIRTVMHHRASPEFTRSRNCFTNGVHYYREPAQGQ